MIAAVGSRLVILLFGTLYPAYASYKAVRNKDVKAYVQWMMYWIVFALFTCAETFSDVFLSFWVPFYYELKVVIVLWLLSPATKGSSLLYRKFVHPTLTEREKEIDEYLAKMRERSYSTMLELGSKGINYALQTAIKSGGGIVNHLRRSYSLSDLTDQTDANMAGDLPPRQHRPPRGAPVLEDSDDTDDLGSVSHRGYSPRRSASGSGRMEMYFPAVDVDVRQRDVRQPPAGKSVTALSCEAADQVDAADSGMEVEGGEPLVRTASLSSTRSSGRIRRAANPVATTPSGRKSVVASVPEAPEAASLPPPTPPSSDLSDSLTEISEASTLLADSISPITLDSQMSDDINEMSTLVSDQESGVSVETQVERSLGDEGSATVNETLGSENLAQVNETALESVNEIYELSKETPPVCCENYEDLNNDNFEFDEVLEERLREIKAENENLLVEMEEKESEIEFMEALSEKLKELQNEERRSEEARDPEKNPNVLVTVEVQSENPGSMLVRLSMESLPTSAKQAEQLDCNIPTTVVEKYDSLKTSNDSLASCSLPGTPSVSRSNSRMSEGRAGKYNKLPAPLRPESPIAEEENPVKARLVLQPGVVRKLPETRGDTSEVFLAKDKKKRSKPKASLFPFWGSKPSEQDKPAGEGKSTNL